MRVRAYAKINLGLEVLGKRSDGYHELRTLFQTIGLHDDLEFHPQGKEILLQGSDPSIRWDETNLIHRAARALRERFPIREGIRIKVNKRIPAGKGLGGGSSNAAASLMALNRLWKLGAEKEVLVEIGGRLGADVPFFFFGGLCLGEGIGDRLSPLKDLDRRPCLLVFPSVAVSTAAVYERVGPSLTSEGKDSKIIRFLDSGDPGCLENDLEKIVLSVHPQIKAIKRLLQEQGSALSMVSGSGSAVFGLFRTMERAREAERRLGREFRVLLTETLPRDLYWKGVGAGV